MFQKIIKSFRSPGDFGVEYRIPAKKVNRSCIYDPKMGETNEKDKFPE